MSVVAHRFRGMSSPVDTDIAHPALAGCARLDAVLDELVGPVTDSGDATDAGHKSGVYGALPLWSSSDSELCDVLRATDRVTARAAGLRARVIAECARRELPERSAATGGTAWLSGQLRAHPARAKTMWRTACQLAEHAPAADTALCAGSIDTDQAGVVAGAVAALPAEVPDDVRARGEAFLLGEAEQLNAAPLAHVANHLLDVIAPDLADAKLAEQLDREEKRAEQVSLSAANDGHGMVSLRGRFDVESWAVVAAGLDPLAKPRPAGADSGTDKLPEAEADGTGRDRRSYPQRMGEALVELARRQLEGGALPSAGGHKPQLALTIDYEALRDQVGAGVLDTGEALSVAAVRRLACDAQLCTVLTDRHGHPLDVGRTQRLVPAPIRRGLVVRDRGCAFPGCTRPPAWCDAHHIVSWIDGGVTSLANGVLLCRFHHRVVHRGDWSIHLGADHRPWFTPPDWIDPTRQPRLNRSHLRM